MVRLTFQTCGMRWALKQILKIKVKTFASVSKLFRWWKVSLSGPGEVFSASFNFFSTSAVENLEEIGGVAAAFVDPNTDRSTGGVVDGKNFSFKRA